MENGRSFHIAEQGDKDYPDNLSHLKR